MVFFSKGLAPRHHSLSTYEKELLAAVQGVELASILRGKAFCDKD